jgi:hypothetical protein
MVGLPFTNSELRGWLEERKPGIMKGVHDTLASDIARIYLDEECAFPGQCVGFPNKPRYGRYAGMNYLVCYAYRTRRSKPEVLKPVKPMYIMRAQYLAGTQSYKHIQLAVAPDPFDGLRVIERPEVIRPQDRQRAARESAVAFTYDWPLKDD